MAQLLCIPFFIITGFINEISFEVLRVPTEFTPGKYEMLMFMITNNSTQSIRPKITMQLPKGWTIITEPSINTLASGASKRLVYSVAIAKNIFSDNATIQLKIHTAQKLVFTKKIPVRIKKVHRINLSVLGSPPYLSADTFFTCNYLLVNNGNVSEKIQLRSNNGTIYGKVDLKIPVDSSLVVQVQQQSLKKIITPTTMINDLSVELSEIDTVFTKQIAITVYPNRTNRQDVYHRYPLRAIFLYKLFHRNNTPVDVLQYNITGTGFLDRKKKHGFEIMLKGTDNVQVSSFENYSRYLIKYRIKNSSISFGDVSLGLSQLLEAMRLGKGIIYSQKAGNFQLQTFYNTLPYFPSIKQQMGGSLNYKINKNLNLKLNTIFRDYTVGSESSFAGSLFGNYTSKKVSVKAEYALSKKSGKLGMGASLNGSFMYKKIKFNSDFMFTGANFEGYFNNSLSFSGGLNYLLMSHFYLTAGAGYSLVNPKTDILFAQVTPFSQNYSTGLRYQKNKIWKQAISYSYRSNLDRSTLAKFNYQEDRFHYQINYNKDYFQSSLTSSLSNTQNILAESEKQKGTSLDLSYNGSYVFTPYFKMGINMAYAYTNRYRNQSVQYLYYGGNLSYAFRQKFQLNFNYRNNYAFEEQYKRNSLFSLNAHYKIFPRHSISFIGRLAGDAEKNFTFSFKYTLNVGIPLNKNKNLGHLKGQIIAPKGVSAEGILMNLNGLVTISNASGLFEFNDVAVGQNYLTNAQGSTPKGYIVSESLPESHTIVAKKTHNTILHLIQPLKITGKVVYKKNKQVQAKEFTNTFPQLIIKLQKGEFVLYTRTDQNGEFSFSEVKPGKWDISIVTKGLEKKYTFPKKSKQLNLSSGKDIFVSFQVKDKSRKIKFKNKKFNLN